MSDDIASIGFAADTSGVEKAGAALDDLAARGEAAGKSIDGIEESVKRTGKSLDTLGSGGARAAAGLGEVGEKTGKVAHSIGGTASAANAAAKQLSDLDLVIQSLTLSEQKYLKSLADEAMRVSSTRGEYAAYIAESRGMSVAAQEMAQLLGNSTEAFKKSEVAAGGLTRQHGLMRLALTQTSKAFGVNLQQARVFATGLMTLGPIVGGVAAALGVLAYAYYKGGKEFGEFNKALIMSGNVAGTTASQLQGMASAIAQTGRSRGDAVEALTAIAKSGAVAGANLQQFATIAVDVAKVTGQSVSETASQFADLAKEPLQASLKLTEKHHYLTAAIYDQIKALEEQGQKTEAARLAQETYADSTKQRVAEVKENLGLIERAWNQLALGARLAWNDMMGLGRAKEGQELVDALVKEREELRKTLENSAGNWMPGSRREQLAKQIEDINRQIGDLQEKNKAPQVKANNDRKENEFNENYTGLAQAAAKYESDALKTSISIAEVTEKYQKVLDGINEKKAKGLDVSNEEVEAMNRYLQAVNGINDAFSRKQKKAGVARSTPEESALRRDDDYLNQLKAEYAQLQSTGGEVEKLTKTEKDLITIKDRLANNINMEGKALTEATRRVMEQDVAKKEAIINQEKANKAISDEAVERKKADAVAQKWLESTKQNTENLQAQIDAHGKSKIVVEQELLTRMKAAQVMDAEIKLGGRWVKVTSEMVDAKKADIAAMQALNNQQWTDGIDKQIQAAKDQLALDKESLSLMGATSQERAKAVALRKVELEYDKKLLDLQKQLKAGEISQAQFAEDRVKLDELRAEQSAAAISHAYADEWNKTTDEINRSLTDALMRGFESGKGFAKNFRDTLRNMTFTIMLRPVVGSIVGGFTSMLMGPALPAAVSGGSSLLGAASNLSSLTSLLGTFGSGLSGGFQALLGGNGLTALTTGFGSLMSGGISSGLGVMAGVAGPIAAIAVPVLSALFGKRNVQHNLQGMFGGDAGFMGRYEDYSSSILGGGHSSYSPVDSALQKVLADAWKAQSDAVINYAQTLGLATDKIEGFSFYANLKLKDIKTDDPQQYQTEVMKLVGDAIRSGSNEMAKQLIGTLTDTGKTETQYYIDTELGGRQKREVPVYEYTPSEYARDGEEAIDTLTRLATSLQAANAAFGTLGQTLLEGSLASGDMASSLMDLFGGIDNFNQIAAGYLQNYYTASEQLAVIRKQIQDTIEGAGGTMPGSRSQFRAMVDQAQADFAAGVEGAAELLAALMQVSDAFAQITPNLFQGGQDMASAITQGMLGTWDGDNLGAYLAQTVQDGIYNAIAGNFAGQITDIIVAGVVEPVISAAVAGSAISEAVSAESISAMVAQAQAVADAFATIMSDPAFMQAITDITRAIGTIKIPSVHATAAVNNYTSAVSSSGSAATTAASQVSNAWQQIADSLIEQVRRIRGEMADAGEQSLAYWESQFAINTAMARAGDQDAAGNLVGLSDSLLQAAQNQAGSMLELQQIRAAVAQSLQDTAGYAQAFAGAAAGGATSSSAAADLAAYQAARADPANWAQQVSGTGAGGMIYIGPAAPTAASAAPAAPVAAPAQMVVPQAIAPQSGTVTVTDPKVLEKIEQLRVEQQAQAAALAATQGVLVRFVRQVEAEGGMPPVRPDAPPAKVKVVA